MKKRMMLSVVGALAAVALTVTPVRAQSGTDCRCVDADGNEIERCTCFRSPEMHLQGLPGLLAGASTRPRLGVSIDPGQSARRDAEGAYVTDVMDGGPADEAGIREGDVITSVDGHSLTAPIGADAEEDFDLDRSVPVQRLLAIVDDLEPGRSVEVEYLRGDRRQTTMVEVEDLSDRWGAPSVALPRWNQGLRERLEAPRDDALGWRSAPDDEGVLRYRLRGAPPAPDVRVFGPRAELLLGGGLHDGLSLAEVNPGLGAYFGTDEGVLVLDAERGRAFGLQAGDVILRIGTRSVDTPDRARRILASYGPDEDIEFHILRDGSEQVVTGRHRY